jgi:hypothetical protein
MRRAIILCGTVSFVMAFLGGSLAFSLVAPAPATAQSSQLEEVRASAFVVVAPDGTVVGRLGQGDLGNGNLGLFDVAGRQRWQLNGEGGMTAFDTDGTRRFRAGFQPVSGPAGSPPLNGVLLDANGSVSVLP